MKQPALDVELPVRAEPAGRSIRKREQPQVGVIRGKKLDRAAAFAIVTEHTGNGNLVKHMLAVEIAMRAYARKHGEDEEKWAVTGLLHDFDYELHPNAELSPDREHPSWGVALLRERGCPEEICLAILGHAFYTGVARASLMAKVLFACDELTGLISAVALVRPSKKIAEVKLKSIRKKWKQKAFAAGVNREEIEQGAEELGVDLNEHIQFVLEAMQHDAELLGL